MTTPERHLQLVNVAADKRDEYLRLHAAVWPDVEAQIRRSNISNYSIFIRDELLIAYFEYVGTDYAADMAAMAADPTTRAWWALTDPCQVPLAGASTGSANEKGSVWSDASEVWHLS
jgi:L-rhamnose mutarotase